MNPPKTIPESEYTLEYIEEQLKYWQTQKVEIRKLMESIKIAKNTQKLLDQIHNVIPQNSIREFLYNDTKTIPIIDRFCNNNSVLFLIFERVFYYCGWLDIVICKQYNHVNIIPSLLTATNVKQIRGTHIHNIEHYKEQRHYELMKLITSIPKEQISSEKSIPFSKPFQFNAQSSMNRTGYGYEYHGDDLVSQGTHYGETTTFAIIGVIVE